jgi:CHAT domain-containing protein/tetratricopeptide (TPR) repeat protein
MRAYKYLLTGVACSLLRLSSPAQNISNAFLRRDLINLDTNHVLSRSQKQQLLYDWKTKADAAQLPQDSTYALLLHKLGVNEFYSSKRYNTAILLTLKALRINTSGSAGSSPTSAETDMYNIAFYYDRLALLKKALLYYDSAILLARRNGDIDKVIPDSWNRKAYTYFRMGDYEKAVRESDRLITYALQNGDSLRYLYALNERAQTLSYQQKYAGAGEDARTAISLARALHDDFELASALKSQGFIFAGLRNLPQAEASFTQCIASRLKSKNLDQLASDYNDLGNFYNDTLKAFHRATDCFLRSIQYTRKENDSPRTARSFINLGRSYYYEGEFHKALSSYAQAMDYLRIGVGKDNIRNPTARALNGIDNKELIQILFNSKTELLLGIYRQTHDPKWLAACLQTATLNDSLIRDIRHEQSEEQTKLYWRDHTTDFFTNAMDACYLAHDDSLAFYFMEESRSVLLQDRLTELGAHALLPAAEAAKEERLQIDIVELQQKRNNLPDTSTQGRIALQQLLAANDSLEQFIRSLETTYPAYYQYKYADDVHPLSLLQNLLKKNNQTFIDYLIGDTLCFALCVQPTRTQFIRIENHEPGIGNQLIRMVNSCADENTLNKNYPEFLTRSNDLYRLLFEPFHLTPGRVIICQDNYLIPFEALSKNPVKADFLLKNYAFSYVYSARYLLDQHQQLPDSGSGRGDFLGIAPVTFTAYTGLADLSLSEDALRNCSAPYDKQKLLLHTDATRQNFMRLVCDYNTTTILTHARADSADDEPVLFMTDSVIHLSELQMLSNPAAKLVVLSACETNVGKNRNGEGIFSLARGFSAAGIPAVAATQWMADETAIYSISQKFNEYIFRGMNKDEALQQAKLYYISQDKRGNPLPCYWAAMILIGNTEPVHFSTASKTGWLFPALIMIVLLIAVLTIYKTVHRFGYNNHA